jgi:adenylosuccinate lyase
MPHKRNPILSENLCGLARMMRAYASAALENTPLWHERDISHSSAERMIAPDATTTLGFMLERATRLVDGLVVYPDAHRREPRAPHRGLWASEAVLLALVGRAGRQEAYVLVQRNAMRAWRREGTSAPCSAPTWTSRGRLDAETLDACFDLDARAASRRRAHRPRACAACRAPRPAQGAA